MGWGSCRSYGHVHPFLSIVLKMWDGINFDKNIEKNIWLKLDTVDVMENDFQLSLFAVLWIYIFTHFVLLLLLHTGHHQRVDYYARYFKVCSKYFFYPERRNWYVQIKLCYIQFKTFISRRLIFDLGHLSFRASCVLAGTMTGGRAFHSRMVCGRKDSLRFCGNPMM